MLHWQVQKFRRRLPHWSAGWRLVRTRRWLFSSCSRRAGSACCIRRRGRLPVSPRPPSPALQQQRQTGRQQPDYEAKHAATGRYRLAQPVYTYSVPVRHGHPAHTGTKLFLPVGLVYFDQSSLLWMVLRVDVLQMYVQLLFGSPHIGQRMYSYYVIKQCMFLCLMWCMCVGICEQIRVQIHPKAYKY